MTEPSTGLEAIIRGRQSVRRFLPDAVPDADIVRLIRAAGRAPSAHNRQPWRFRVVRDAAGKADLASAMGRKLEQDRLRDGDDPAAIQGDVKRSAARITGAPVVIAVCLTREEMDPYPDPRRADAEFLMAVQSTAMAAQNLLLLAHAEGFGACWLCAPLFCGETVRDALALPASWEPQGLILLGRAAEPGKNRDRKTLPEILFGIEVS